MDADIKRVLDYLNENKMRATYGTLRDLLGLDSRPNWS